MAVKNGADPVVPSGPGPLRRMRRALVRRALSGAVAVSGRWSDAALERRVAAALRAGAWALGPSLRANLARVGGFGRPVDEMERGYFERARLWAHFTARTYHRGFDRSGFAEEGGRLAESAAHVEEAAAGGRGVVLVGPHEFGHELLAALLNRRLPLVGVVRREDQNAEILAHWYRQVGMPTILRPAHASAISEHRALLAVLARGSVLGITPDLPGGPGEGTPVRFLGRSVRLRAGGFWLASRAKAPVVHYWITYEGGRFVVNFSPPATVVREPGVSNEVLLERCLQEWTHGFEARLRARPEGWAFWLDRRWARVFRQPEAPS